MSTTWFIAIAVLWTGYLFLEGFDFGVGMLHPLLGSGKRERAAVLHTIGPVWDGNEVWLITAVGAMFAAFPGWYAALLSTVYLPLLVVLLGLIVRGVAFEFREQVDRPLWRNLWSAAIVAGSLLPSLGVGFALAATATGLPLDAHGDRVGGAAAVLSGSTVLGALAFTGFALLHGAAFVALKTRGVLRRRARRFALLAGPVALLPVVALVLDIQARAGDPVSVAVTLFGAAAAVLAWPLLYRWREGPAFVALGVAVAATVGGIFLAMYPVLLPSTLDPQWSITVGGAASAPYTLRVLTWLAAFGLPVVLAYQAWTYWVFRTRIGVR